MKVYVAERGLYESNHVAGIYDSAERAMADLDSPKATWLRAWWEREQYDEWTNGLDWDEHVRIYAMDVISDGPTAPPCPAEFLVWAGPRGPLNSIPISNEAADAIAGRGAFRNEH